MLNVAATPQPHGHAIQHTKSKSLLYIQSRRWCAPLFLGDTLSVSEREGRGVVRHVPPWSAVVVEVPHTRLFRQHDPEPDETGDAAAARGPRAAAAQPNQPGAARRPGHAAERGEPVSYGVQYSQLLSTPQQGPGDPVASCYRKVESHATRRDK